MHVSAARMAVHTGIMGCRGEGRMGLRQVISSTNLEGAGYIRTSQIHTKDVEELEMAIG